MQANKKILLCLALATGGVLRASVTETSHVPAAVGYYIAVRASINGPDEIDVFGASNLPPGSELTVDVSDFIGEGSQSLNQEVTVRVGPEGLFRFRVRPQKGKAFRRNLPCLISFQPTYPQQPEKVLSIVGRMGEHLGNPWENPQLDGNPRVKTLQALTPVQ